MEKRSRLAFAEGLVVWGFRRRYLKESQASDGPPRYEDLAATAMARLSFAGVRQLREALVSEREGMRDRGHHRLADSLTSAIRGLDTRLQILDDLLH